MPCLSISAVFFAAVCGTFLEEPTYASFLCQIASRSAEINADMHATLDNIF